MTKRKVRIREFAARRSTSSGWRMPLLRLAREQLGDDELRAVRPRVRSRVMTDLFAFTIAIAVTGSAIIAACWVRGASTKTVATLAVGSSRSGFPPNRDGEQVRASLPPGRPGDASAAPRGRDSAVLEVVGVVAAWFIGAAALKRRRPTSWGSYAPPYPVCASLRSIRTTAVNVDVPTGLELRVRRRDMRWRSPTPVRLAHDSGRQPRTPKWRAGRVAVGRFGWDAEPARHGRYHRDTGHRLALDD